MSVVALPPRRPATAPEGERPAPDAFRDAMRQLAGGLSVITIGEGEDRTGLAATSVTSLSVDPPTLLVCVDRASSSWPLLQRYGRFGVNVLGEAQRAVADRFAGRGGERGAARYEGAEWGALVTGAPLLRGALARLDCRVDEIIVRHSHAIVLGGVVAAEVGGNDSPLLYWRGAYGGFAPRT